MQDHECESEFVGVSSDCQRGDARVGGAAVWGWVWAVVVVGCGSGSTDSVQTGTDTDGVITTGIPDGADETGTSVPYYCIYNTNNGGLVGVKHQCRLEYDLDITFTVSLLDGSSFEVPLQVSGVQTVSDESTYENPFVMACCTDIRDAPGWPFADSCETRQHEACMSDFIQHVCNAPGNWLLATADDFVGSGKEAIEAAAVWLSEHRQECYDHFWTGPDALHDVDECDPMFDHFFHHTPWEPSETFQYVLPLTNVVFAEVSNIVVAPHSAFGQDVPLEPPTSAESCSHPNANNGEVPPLSSVEPGGHRLAPVAPAPVEVEGPELGGSLVVGTGDVGIGSVLRWTEDGTGARRIERWVMTEAAATTVGTEMVEANVEHFKLTLARPVTTKVHEDGWRIEAGMARFVLGATVDGHGSNVQATNATSIELHTVSPGSGTCPTQASTCVQSSAFIIDHEDEAGQLWTLDVPALTWRP